MKRSPHREVPRTSGLPIQKFHHGALSVPPLAVGQPGAVKCGEAAEGAAWRTLTRKKSNEWFTTSEPPCYSLGVTLMANRRGSVASATCRFCDRGQEPQSYLPAGNTARPSLGALLPLWTLVISQVHETASARLGEKQRLALFEDALSVARSMPGSAFLFEHGAVASGSATACATAHAHLHVLPFDDDLLEYANRHLAVPGSWKPIDPQSLGDYLNTEYLLAGREGSLFVKSLIQPTSQYFRKAIAHYLGEPEEWNWRDRCDVDDTYMQTHDFLNARFA